MTETIATALISKLIIGLFVTGLLIREIKRRKKLQSDLVATTAKAADLEAQRDFYKMAAQALDRERLFYLARSNAFAWMIRQFESYPNDEDTPLNGEAMH